MTLVKDTKWMLLCILCVKIVQICVSILQITWIPTMDTPIVHAPALRLGQKWQKNTIRPKKTFLVANEVRQHTPRWHGFLFFWGE
jgi:hypothetical protein